MFSKCFQLSGYIDIESKYDQVNGANPPSVGDGRQIDLTSKNGEINMRYTTNSGNEWFLTD